MKFFRGLHFKFFIVITFVLLLSNIAMLWVYKNYGRENFNKIVEKETELIDGRVRDWGKKITEVFYSSITLSKARIEKFDEDDKKHLYDNVKILRQEKGIDAVNIFSSDSLQEPKIKYSGDPIESNRLTKPLDCMACHSKELTPYKLKALKSDETVFVYGEPTKNLRNEDNYQIITHLYNQQSCRECHGSANKVVGVIQLNFNVSEGRGALKEIKAGTLKEMDKTGKIVNLMLIVNLVTALIATFFISFIIKKILKLKNVFESICYGNTDVDLDSITKSKDEVRDIGDALSRMVTAIKIYMK